MDIKRLRELGGVQTNAPAPTVSEVLTESEAVMVSENTQRLRRLAGLPAITEGEIAASQSTTLLNEIFNWEHGTDLADHADRVLQRLDDAGARKEHGPEMAELEHLISDYRNEMKDPEHAKRMINGGSESALAYVGKQINRAIDDLGYQVRASTGAGGFNKGTREQWANKQAADPKSRRIRDMRNELNSTELGEGIEDQHSEVMSKFQKKQKMMSPEQVAKFKKLDQNFGKAYDGDDEDQAADILDDMKQTLNEAKAPKCDKCENTSVGECRKCKTKVCAKCKCKCGKTYEHEYF